MPLLIILTKEERSDRFEHRSSSASPKNIVHWVTHARKKGVGMWAWLLHRVTAIITLITVSSHVLKNQFGYIIPGGRLVSIDLLVFALTYHTLNGLRVIFIESSEWAAIHEDSLFWVVISITIVLIFSWIIWIDL
jgi:succinate dehydrogenase/fumarate reductase cytochrome b subunit